MATTAKPTPPAPTRDARERGIAEAMHSLEMEGLQPTAASQADAQEFVDGQIDAAEMVRRARARHGLEH